MIPDQLHLSEGKIARFKQRGLRNSLGFTTTNKMILCCVPFVSNKTENRISVPRERKNWHSILRYLQTWKRLSPVLRNISYLKVTKFPLTTSSEFPKHAEIYHKCPTTWQNRQWREIIDAWWKLQNAYSTLPARASLAGEHGRWI